MPFAPPVTTTTLPLTCMAAPVILKLLSGQHEVEHGSVVARRAQEHERMPDHVLKAKPLPCVEDYPETVEQATGDKKPERQLRQRGQAGVVGDRPAPPHSEVETDRHAVETAREKQHQQDADCRQAPAT